MTETLFHVPKRLGLFAFPILLLAPVLSAAAPASVRGAAQFFRPKVTAPAPRRSAPKTTSGVFIVNAASYLPGISPGGIASIFGPNLSVVTDIQYSTTFDPLSTVIADVSVAVNGVFAPLFAVAYTGGQDQINIQVPYETPTGLGAAVVDVYSGNTLVAHEVVDSYTEDPGIFIDGNYNAIAVHVDDFSLITADNPAVPNEYIVLYTTGLGPLDVPLLDGYGAPSTEPLARTLDQTFQAQINGENCGLLFSGLGPGFVGLYQLNLQLPSDLPPGRLPLQINTIYADSGVAYLSVN